MNLTNSKRLKRTALVSKRKTPRFDNIQAVYYNDLDVWMSIWAKIKLYAEKREQEVWLRKHHCDQKCPKCNTWQGNCNGWSEVIRNYPTPMNDKTKCGKCGQWTTWFDFGMGLTLADNKTGLPLNEKD